MEMILRIDISKALFRYLTMKSAGLRFRCHYYDLSYSSVPIGSLILFRRVTHFELDLVFLYWVEELRSQYLSHDFHPMVQVNRVRPIKRFPFQILSALLRRHFECLQPLLLEEPLRPLELSSKTRKA